MTRRLSALVIALLWVAGVGLAGTPAQAQAQAQVRNVIPHHGVYQGTDHGGRVVSFSFGNHNQLTHFTVGHLVIGGAHVSNGAWHETCHNGYCFKGQWVSDSVVHGAWRHGSSQSWTAFTTHFQPTPPPYQGTYMGWDHHGTRIHLSYASHQVVGFRIGQTVIGNAHVSDRRFEVCHQHVCFKGHWQTDHEVVGSWRPATGSTWVGWEAYAYSA